MIIKRYHWIGAITLSLLAHGALLINAKTPEKASGERSAGNPNVVWGVASQQFISQAEPLEPEVDRQNPLRPDPVEPISKNEPLEEQPVKAEPLAGQKQLAELRSLEETEAKEIVTRALVDDTPALIPATELDKIEEVDVIEPVREREPAPQKSEDAEVVEPIKEKEPVVKKKTDQKRKKKAVSRNTGPVGKQKGNKGKTKTAAISRAARTNYASQVVSQLRRHKRSPGAGNRGTVRLVFVLGKNGSVRSVRIARSSGNSKLDREALSMVRRAAPFPPFPPGIGKSSLSFTVPVSFVR